MLNLNIVNQVAAEYEDRLRNAYAAIDKQQTRIAALEAAIKDWWANGDNQKLHDALAGDAQALEKVIKEAEFEAMLDVATYFHCRAMVTDDGGCSMQAEVLTRKYAKEKYGK